MTVATFPEWLADVFWSRQEYAQNDSEPWQLIAVKLNDVGLESFESVGRTTLASRVPIDGTSKGRRRGHAQGPCEKRPLPDDALKS